MLYLLWAIINIGIFLCVIVTAFKTVRLIKQRVGLIAAIVFVVGVFSLLGSVGNIGKDLNKNQTLWNFSSDESVEIYGKNMITIPLQNNLISSYGLVISYGISKEDHKNVPINADCFTSGLTSGTYLIPTSVIVNTTDDNKKFQYQVEGDIEWRLMGFIIYSHSKTFKGIAQLK